jgi:hypothetical protein
LKTNLLHRPTAIILIGFGVWRHFAGSSPADGIDVTPDVTSDVTIFRNFAILPKCERTKTGPMRYGGAPGPNVVGRLGKGGPHSQTQRSAPRAHTLHRLLLDQDTRRHSPYSRSYHAHTDHLDVRESPEQGFCDFFILQNKSVTHLCQWFILPILSMTGLCQWVILILLVSRDCFL